jgi:hypothetical protein
VHERKTLAVMVVGLAMLSACSGDGGPSVSAGGRRQAPSGVAAAKSSPYVGFRYANTTGGLPEDVELITASLLPGIPYGFGVSHVDTPDGQLLWLERMIAVQDFDCSAVPDPVSCRLQPGVGAWEVVSVLELPKSVTTGGSGDVVVFGVPCELDGVPDDEAVVLFTYTDALELSGKPKAAWVANRLHGRFVKATVAEARCDNPYAPVD